MKTAFTGGIGLLGSYIVERLLEQEHEVCAPAYQTSDITHLTASGAEIVVRDLTDINSLHSLKIIYRPKGEG